MEGKPNTTGMGFPESAPAHNGADCVRDTFEKLAEQS